MKKTIFFIVLAVLMSACGKDSKTKGMKKIADYLYEYKADDYGPEPPSEIPLSKGKVAFGCSVVRNGDFIGRNFDFTINESCEFVVRTKATATRPHATIGVSNPAFITVTDDMVKEGLGEEILQYLPWMLMDGINDAGLICISNLVNQLDLDVPHEHTSPGKPQIMSVYLVRAILDNCGNVAEAISYIKDHDIVAVPAELFGTEDLHVMIADPESTVVVEFKEGGIEVINANMMTNFYNFLYPDDGSVTYSPYACGTERYKILRENYSNANSMEEMWELMKSVRYSRTFDATTDPFWCSEFYEYFSSIVSAEEILNDELVQAVMNAFQHYAETGECSIPDVLWFTVHNSIYDINKRKLWVTVREKYEKRYEFKL